MDDSRWGAAEVRKGSDRYMLLYGDQIVLLFTSDMVLTDEQVSILTRRLGPSD